MPTGKIGIEKLRPDNGVSSQVAVGLSDRASLATGMPSVVLSRPVTRRIAWTSASR
jgi:hypothetical protein